MKTKLSLFAIASFMLLCANTFAQDPNFCVFFCFGQSNMEGAARPLPEYNTVDSRLYFTAEGYRKLGCRYAVKIILDNLYADKKAIPMIVIMPNGRAMKDDRATGNINAQGKLYKNAFPMGDVKLLDGPFKQARDLNTKVLLEYDVD
ncbi:MAG: hypothetical protein LBG28_13970, partial [Tannerella sp.]|nr:hypothetical protein [Tannerella sp.]